MMRLFIQVKNGEPFEHPIFESNFRSAFPEIDPENLPEEFAVFVRVQKPALGAYEVYEGVTYEPFGEGYRDVHHVRHMTSEEKTAKQNAVKSSWIESDGYNSWIFNVDTCSFDPPITYPDNSNHYVWSEDTLSWVLPEEQP